MPDRDAAPAAAEGADAHALVQRLEDAAYQFGFSMGLRGEESHLTVEYGLEAMDASRALIAHVDAQAARPASPAGMASVPTVDAAVGLHSECRACGTYTGAYDVEALQARVALLEGLLRQVVRGGHGSKRMRAMIVAALADGG